MSDKDRNVTLNGGTAIREATCVEAKLAQDALEILRVFRKEVGYNHPAYEALKEEVAEQVQQRLEKLKLY